MIQNNNIKYTYESKRGISLDNKKQQFKTSINPNKLKTIINDSAILQKLLDNTKQFHNSKSHSFSPIQRKQGNGLLPPLKAIEYQSTKTLVLDLDETLIHSSQTALPIKADFKLKIDKDKDKDQSKETPKKEMHVLLRPYLDEFFHRISLCYGEVVIFTASQSAYANRIIDAIDKDKVVKYRLFREHCTWVNNTYVKELKRLKRNMRNVVIVDNNPNSFYLDSDNGILIKSFYDNKNDNELLQMAFILEKLSKAFDVRPMIKEILYLNQIKDAKDNGMLKKKKIKQSTDRDIKLKEGNNTIKDNDSKLPTQVKIVNIEKVSLNESPLIIDTNQSPLFKLNPQVFISSVSNHQKGVCHTVGNNKVVNMIGMSNIMNQPKKTRKFFKSFLNNNNINFNKKIENAVINDNTDSDVNNTLKYKGKSHAHSKEKNKETAVKGSYSLFKAKQTITLSPKLRISPSKSPINQLKEINTYTSLLSLKTKKANQSPSISSTTTQSVISKPTCITPNMITKSKKKESKTIITESFRCNTSTMGKKQMQCATDISLAKTNNQIEIHRSKIKPNKEKNSNKSLTAFKNENPALNIDTLYTLTSSYKTIKNNRPIRTFVGKNQCIAEDNRNQCKKTINSDLIKEKSKSELRIIEIIPTMLAKSLKRSKTTTIELTYFNNAKPKKI